MRIRLATIGLAVALAAAPSPALAVFAYNTYGGLIAHKCGSDPRINFTRHYNTMPLGGVKQIAYKNGIDAYSRVQGSALYTVAKWKTSDTDWWSFDDRNSAIVVNPEDIDGAGGVAHLRYNRLTGCLLEVDVTMSWDLNYAEPTSGVPDQGGWAGWVHELGHAAGLDHVAAWSMMQSVLSSPHVAEVTGRKSLPVPFDVEGLRFIYPSGMSIADNVLSASTFPDPANPSIGINQNFGRTAATVPVMIDVEQGCTANIRAMSMNDGPGSATFNHRFSIRRLGTTTHLNPVTSLTLNMFESRSQVVAVSVPLSQTTGIYDILHTVDSSGSLAESDENDNKSFAFGKLRVLARVGGCT